MIQLRPTVKPRWFAKYMKRQCPACKAKAAILFEKKCYQCEQCGHLFRVDPGFRYQFYTDVDYWHKDEDYDLRLFQKTYFAMMEDDLKKICKNGKIPKTLIEFGAADGDLLFHIWKASGLAYQVYWNDIVPMLRHEYKSMVQEEYIGTFEDIYMDRRIHGKRFDVMTMVNVIEHIHTTNPGRDIFRKVNDLLNDEGYFIFVTAAGDLPLGVRELTEHDEHFHIFTYESLKHASAGSGLTVVNYKLLPDMVLYVVMKKTGVGYETE